MAKVTILYHSFTGNTRQMAEAAADGARQAGAEAVLIAADQASVADLAGATAVLMATPQTFGSMAAQMKGMLERMWAEKAQVPAGLPLGVIVCHVNDPGATIGLLANVTGRLGFVPFGEPLSLDAKEMPAALSAARELGAALAAAKAAE